jgi:hypothetical protein
MRAVSSSKGGFYSARSADAGRRRRFVETTRKRLIGPAAVCALCVSCTRADFKSLFCSFYTTYRLETQTRTKSTRRRQSTSFIRKVLKHNQNLTYWIGLYIKCYVFSFIQHRFVFVRYQKKITI